MKALIENIKKRYIQRSIIRMADKHFWTAYEYEKEIAYYNSVGAYHLLRDELLRRYYFHCRYNNRLINLASKYGNQRMVQKKTRDFSTN
jgi:hypothetical protein